MIIRKLLAPALLLPSLLLPLEAVGAISPTLTNRNTDVIYLADPWVDAEIKASLIATAHKSVDILNFMHGADTVGTNITHALREAASHGVKVRVAYEFLGSIGKDPLLHTPGLLADSALAVPPQIIVGRLKDKRKHCSYNDFVHEKLILIDAGTPDEKAIIGGRGFTDFAITTFDSAFLIRPVDASQPSLSSLLAEHFEQAWKLMSDNYTVEKPEPLSRYQRRMAKQTPPRLITSFAQNRALSELMAQITRRPKADDELPANEFRPDTVVLSRNDFFQQIFAPPMALKSSVRDRAWIKSDDVDLVADLVRRAQHITQATYVISPPPRLLAAFEEALSNRATIDFYSNGVEAHKKLFPTGAPAFYSLESIANLLENNIVSTHLYLLDANKVSAAQASGDSAAFKYLHRKLVIADDMVITGSDNLTVSSARKNSEILTFMRDARMAKMLRDQLASEQHLYVRIERTEDLQQYRLAEKVYRLFKSQIEANY